MGKQARGSGLMVARSLNGGESWNLINGKYWDLWGGHSILLETDPYYKKRIWAGGSDPYGLAYLLKSTDAGERGIIVMLAPLSVWKCPTARPACRSTIWLR